MALSVPIITEYVGTGLDKFKKELAQAETNSQKAGLIMKKAFVPATAALGALAVALGDAVKGAMEDEAAQRELARSLKATTGATDNIVKATEDWITQQGRLLGVTDTDLRPALSRLARATGDVDKAQRLASQAMDIAVATGKPLEAVVTALEKAYGGNMTALQRLAPEYRTLIKDGASFEEVMAALATTTGGAAAEAADTAAGRFARFKLSLDETKESIGASLLPAVEAVLPSLQNMGLWAEENPEKFRNIAAAIAAVTASIVAMNLAWKGTVFFKASGAFGPLGVLVGAFAAAYASIDSYRLGVNKRYNEWVGIFEGVVNTAVRAINPVIDALNALVPGNPFAKLGLVNIPRLAEKAPAGAGFAALDQIPQMAQGGIVTGPTLALIGEGSEPEAVIPLSKLGNMGAGTTVNINVQGADPQAVVDALRTYMFRNGAVPIRVA